MAGEWHTLRLGKVCKKIGSGATPRGGSGVYLDRGEVALIRSQNVHNDGFRRDGLVYLTAEHAAELANVEVGRDDVLLNITGDSVARSCQVAPDVLPARVNQHVAIIRTDPEILWPRYLRYFLVSPSMQAEMLGLAGVGGTRNALTKGMIESFEIAAPVDVDDQRAIAHILGTLDDKIDLNHQMNETLEAMARATFKSWFVDFDPVRAKASSEPPESICRRLGLTPDLLALFPDRLVYSEPGEIPEGWQPRPFAAWLAYSIGGGWGSDQPDEECSVEVRVIRGTDIPRLKTGAVDDVPHRFIQASKYKSRQLQPEDLVLEVSGGSNDQPTGRSLRITKRILDDLGGTVVPASFCRLLRPKAADMGPILGLHLDFIYEAGKTWEYQNQSTGISNFQTKYFLESELVIDPGDGVREAFAQMVLPLLSGHHLKESGLLAAIRDALLPKLLSGKLPVPLEGIA